jgi:hypothetical protein
MILSRMKRELLRHDSKSLTAYRRRWLRFIAAQDADPWASSTLSRHILRDQEMRGTLVILGCAGI